MGKSVSLDNRVKRHQELAKKKNTEAQQRNLEILSGLRLMSRDTDETGGILVIPAREANPADLAVIIEDMNVMAANPAYRDITKCEMDLSRGSVDLILIDAIHKTKRGATCS